MNHFFYNFFFATSLFLIMGAKAHAALVPDLSSTDLIYGIDNRVEVDQFHDANFVDKSSSVALRVSKRRLTVDRNDSHRILFPNTILKNLIPDLCQDERFIDQISLGNCSGFLVGPKTLVTAGHCMANMQECSDNRWVFGFKESVNELNANQVYSCKKIISQKYVYSDKEVSDYAVIELDREVVGATPLKIRKHGWVATNTPLVVIGHPMGLPMKATDGAKVGRMNDEERKTKIKSFLLRSHYFTANIDSYSGNSGSPVFNEKTGVVEGILVQGAEDFVYNKSKDCRESQKLSDSFHNSYEKVMRINKVQGL
jgi:V8-like Glu-specific endopeptidase